MRIGEQVCVSVRTETVNPDGLSRATAANNFNYYNMRTIKNRNENGRPKLASTEVRKYRIEVRFATEEYFLLKTKARTARLTISDFIRTTLQKCEVKERLTATHLQLITKLTGMANDLNQIAKRANQAGYIAAKNESETLAKSIDNVIKSIENDG